MKLGTIKSINDWNLKEVKQSKQIHAQSSQLKLYKVESMFKVNNKDQQDTVIDLVLMSL